MYIDPSNRGQGIGRELFSVFKDRSIKMGVKFIELSVDMHNEESVNIWESLKFKTHQLKMRRSL